MDNFIDLRGFNADKAWMLIKDSMKSGRSITSVTDSLDNAKYIERMAESLGLETHLEEMGSDYFIHLSTRLKEHDDNLAISNNTIVITGCTFGRGDERLGKVLMRTYIYNLKTIKPLPKCIIFVNSGVTLAIQDSEVLEDLKQLSQEGVNILSSSTCLEYYKLTNKLAVGGVADMMDIARRMQMSENTIVI